MKIKMPVFRSGVVLILAGVACKRSKPYRIDYDSIKSEWLQDILLSGRKDISTAVVDFLITKFHANFILNKWNLLETKWYTWTNRTCLKLILRGPNWTAPLESGLKWWRIAAI